MDAQNETAACQHLFDALTEVCLVRTIKLYRLRLDPAPRVPILPCLDHEAMLHDGIPRHAAAYLEDLISHDLHEIVFIPARSLIEIDIVSTADEHSTSARERLVSLLRQRFPSYTVKIKGPSILRGDRRVANACRAQVSLRDILNSDDFDRLNAALERLRMIGTLMEKESRVASWGVRTVTAPLLAAAGFALYRILGTVIPRIIPQIGDAWVRGFQYAIVGAMGACFLYYGLKAVQLTEMANRVWKRSAEYSLILAERRRLKSPAAPLRAPGAFAGRRPAP